MGLLIFLRTDSTPSYFRRALLGLINLNGVDEILLCSGYFSEGPRCSVSAEIIRNANLSGKRVTLIGGMFDSRFGRDNLLRFKSFARSISRVVGRANLSTFRAVNNKWHAKVAIALQDGIPQAALIGSSNLSSRTFPEKSPFNHEADVLIWRPSHEKYFRELRNAEDIDVPDRGLSPIDVILNPKTLQADEGARLDAMYKVITRSPKKPLSPG